MRFDPAKGFDLDLLGAPMLAPDFIEQTETLIAPRTGWAPPRKRPRRVYKKLAARGFRSAAPREPGSGMARAASRAASSSTPLACGRPTSSASSTGT